MLIATRFKIEAVELVTSTATNISQTKLPSCQISLTYIMCPFDGFSEGVRLIYLSS